MDNNEHTPLLTDRNKDKHEVKDVVTTPRISQEIENAASIIRITNPNLTYAQAIKTALILSASTIGTYTFSFLLTIHAIMAGRLGEKYLGSAILSTSFLNAVATLSIAINFAVAPTVKTYIGHAQTENINAALKRSFMLSLPVTAVFSIPLIASEKMLRAFGQSAENAELAGTYLKTSTFMLSVLGLRLAAEQILFAHDKHTDAMKMALLAFIPGIISSYALCFGELGSPKLELEGLAYGMLVQESLTLALFLLYLHVHPELRPHEMVKNIFKSISQEDLKEIKALLRFGLPITATVASDVLASFMLPLFVGRTGDKGIKAYNISGQLAAFMQFLTASFGQTMMAQVKGAIAKANTQDARTLVYSGLIASGIVIGPICVTAMSAPWIVTKIFADTDVGNDVKDLAEQLTPIVAMGVIFDTLRYYFLQILRATGDNDKATLISTALTFVGIILAFVLGEEYASTLFIVLAYEISVALSAATLAPRFNTKTTISYLTTAHVNQSVSDDDINLGSPLPPRGRTNGTQSSICCNII